MEYEGIEYYPVTQGYYNWLECLDSIAMGYAKYFNLDWNEFEDYYQILVTEGNI